MTHLTPSEEAIRATLEANRDCIVSYADLVLALGYVHPGANPGRTLQTHIANLRAKGVQVVSVRGRGCILGSVPRPALTSTRSPVVRVEHCRECGVEFQFEMRRQRPYQYCEEHRGEARHARYRRIARAARNAA